MKIVYLYSRMEKNFESSGEAKKAFMQVNALKNLGAEADIYIHNQCIPFYKIRIRLPGYNTYNAIFRKELIDYIISNKIDAVYIRKHLIDNSFLKLLDEIKQIGVKVIFEIPTYPYDMEWKQIQDWPLLCKERVYRKKISGRVDRIVTYSKDEEIFGVKCINSSNGIESRNIPVKKPKNINNNDLFLLGVATLEKWHGYDRLIRGLATYYKRKGYNSKKIIFHIVGEGAELNNLKKLVGNLGLKKYVIFHGYMHGQELTNMFDMADIGIGSLGMYRIGLYDGYTLKLREYMARGLPFIYAYNDELIEGTNCNYYMKYPNCNEEIDLFKLLDFDNRMSKINNIQEIMHGIAVKYLTWESQMTPVMEYLNEKPNPPAMLGRIE